MQGVSAKEIVCELETELSQTLKNGNLRTGFETGFADLDCLTNGLHESSLIILAGRPKVGKTNLMLNIAQNAAIKLSLSTAIFSLTGKSKGLLRRMASIMANVHTTNLRLALMSDQHKNEIYKAFDQILISSLVMFEENFALSELEDECRTLKDRDPALRAVFIDDIEALAEVENESDFERNKITNRLCKLAKELRVTILVTTTLDEPTAGQEKLPPRISELKKCVNPNLAQDVFLLHRDIYEANAELIVAKEESGYCLPLALKFCSSSGKFTGFQPSEEALSLQSEAQVPSALREK